MKGIREKSLSGLSVLTKDTKRLRMHILLASYGTYIPEAEYILAIKQGVKTNCPCFICLISKSPFVMNVKREKRTVCKTVEILDHLRRGKVEGENELKTFPMLSIEPLLFDFPMCQLHNNLHICTIF